MISPHPESSRRRWPNQDASELDAPVWHLVPGVDDKWYVLRENDSLPVAAAGDRAEALAAGASLAASYPRGTLVEHDDDGTVIRCWVLGPDDEREEREDGEAPTGH